MVSEVRAGATSSDLFVGLVRAIGTELTDVIDALKTCFKRAGYAEDDFEVVDIAGFFDGALERLSEKTGNSPPFSLPAAGDGRYRYYSSRMDAGDWIRSQAGSDVLAQLAVAEVGRRRLSNAGTGKRRVYIFKSLMHPKEVEFLRSIYGRRFFLVAVYSSAEARRSFLIEALRSSTPREELAPASQAADALDKAASESERKLLEQLSEQVDELMRRDEGFSEPKFEGAVAPEDRRLAIRKTFAEADLFVTPHELQSAKEPTITGIVERFVEKLFDEPFHTPTRDELGMSHAYVAARRSGSLARSVGAAICRRDGDLLGVGVNDVPAPGGGHYWPAYDGGSDDQREHLYEPPWQDGDSFAGVDSNDQIKLELFTDLANRIFSALDKDMLDPADQLTLFSALKTDPDKVTSSLFKNETVRSAKFFDVIEYSRAVHAEMSALMSCLRNGISTVGAVLYCTTFPCHECSRHLIAAGIGRVVYIEPYSKSRVLDLHSDAVTVEKFTGPPFGRAPGGALDDERLVRFEPFVGFAPRAHSVLYSTTRRKLDGILDDPAYVGKKRHWSLSPNSTMRASLLSKIPAARAAEDEMLIVGERIVTEQLAAVGLWDSDNTPAAKPAPESSKSPAKRTGSVDKN